MSTSESHAAQKDTTNIRWWRQYTARESEVKHLCTPTSLDDKIHKISSMLGLIFG